MEKEPVVARDGMDRVGSSLLALSCVSVSLYRINNFGGQTFEEAILIQYQIICTHLIHFIVIIVVARVSCHVRR